MLAGMTQHHVGNAGEHPEAEVHAVDQTFAVDQFLQQQVVINAGIELGHMQDSIPMFEMIMQITGDQQPTGVREFMHGSVSTRSGAQSICGGVKQVFDRGRILQIDCTRTRSRRIRIR